MAKKGDKLAKILREKLDEEAAVAYQKLDEVHSTHSRKTNGEVLAEKLIETALEKKQWAAELVLLYVEGRPAAAESADRERESDRRIRDVTKHHLNALAADLSPATRKPSVEDREGEESDGGGSRRASDKPATPARRLLDMPSHRNHHPQAAGSQPALAGEDSE